MAGIGDFTYGYETDGVTQYIEEIKANYLDKAAEAVRNTKDIVDVCNSEWEGHARENFVSNLEKDAEHVAQQFEALYDVLKNEIVSLNAAMANKDEELIKVD